MICIRTGISYALTEAMDEGHCGLPTSELETLAAELLDAPAGTRRDRAGSGDQRRDRDCGHGGRDRLRGLAGLYRAERVLADRLASLADEPVAVGSHRSSTRRCRGSSGRSAWCSPKVR